jgi:hypothetical protein
MRQTYAAAYAPRPALVEIIEVAMPLTKTEFQALIDDPSKRIEGDLQVTACLCRVIQTV